MKADNKQEAQKIRRHKKTVCLVCLVCLVFWLNETRTYLKIA